MYKQIKLTELKVGDVFTNSVSLKDRKAYHVISVDEKRKVAKVKCSIKMWNEEIRLKDTKQVILLKTCSTT